MTANHNQDAAISFLKMASAGDVVAVHSHVRQNPDQPGAAVAHLFRFEDGRIVELWDLGQEVPGESPNQYGMF